MLARWTFSIPVISVKHFSVVARCSCCWIINGVQTDVNCFFYQRLISSVSLLTQTQPPMVTRSLPDLASPIHISLLPLPLVFYGCTTVIAASLQTNIPISPLPLTLASPTSFTCDLCSPLTPRLSLSVASCLCVWRPWNGRWTRASVRWSAWRESAGRCSGTWRSSRSSRKHCRLKSQRWRPLS